MDKRVVRLLVEYDGTGYHGLQRQHNSPTVQAALEEALSRIANERVVVALAGRTDTGVHATAQAVSFTSPRTATERDCHAWRRGGNSHLPDDIVIVRAEYVEEDFHARFSALSRRYIYLLSEEVPDRGLNAKRIWHLGKALDCDPMLRAAQDLLGERDFSAFRSSGCNARTPMRNLMSARVSRLGHLIVCDLTANAFLHRMVRMIVGVLVSIGAGKVPQSAIADALEAGSFDGSLMPTAPAHGLYLSAVEYPDGTCFRLPGPLLGSRYV